ncbi:MAG: T9SS type A sorting domain-containing protein, partial [Sphingobacteriales bacterium]|nr:T9SS type A sorting domain-containing protein [Sphingobacteriales bacterium]
SKNGVWYVTEDGSEIIYHFNKDNSPLPSNNIRDIAINSLTGEVFFGTDAGIVSFRNSAIEGGNTHQDVYAFPNPVRPDYSGPVAIRGLVTNANVKITDVAGNVVTDITAEGGQAVWDLKDISGNPVRSGVYFVVSSNEDGSETIITKILIIR